MKEIERIQQMEQALDAVSAAQQNLLSALEQFSMIQPQLLALFTYYGSSAFHHDLSLDDQNLLPKELKRGVLSEDAVHNLLCDLRMMLPSMHEIAERTIKMLSGKECRKTLSKDVDFEFNEDNYDSELSFSGHGDNANQ